MSNPSPRLKTSHPVQLFSAAKPSPQPPSSSALGSVKLKSLIHTLIVSHLCRIIRALSKVKAAVVEILKGNQSNINHFLPYHKKQKMSKKLVFGSFRLHYNWCSSKSAHVVIPVPSRVSEGLPPKAHLCCESDEQVYEDCYDDSQLAGYLQWLEEKVHDDKNEINEIDMLAEMFIADSHEKFRLEKQESDRRFHEMLARGM